MAGQSGPQPTEEDVMQAVAQQRQRGNDAFRAGDWAGAAEAYSAALRLCDGLSAPPDIHLLYSNRAATHLKLQRHAAALQDAEAALAARPAFSKALYRKALALQGLGRLDAAAAAAQQALQEEPGNTDVQALLRQLQTAGKAAAAAAAAAGAGTGAAPAAAAAAAESAPPASASAAVKPAPTAALLPALLAGAPWEYVPPADGVHENLVLLLHGLGDRPAAFARLARQMGLPQAAALALGGPQAVPFTDGRSWYTVFDDAFELIQGRPGEQRRLRSLAQAVAALRQLLGALRRACGWRPDRIHLLGFSQGGTVALELARQQAAAGQPLGSCVAVSGALLEEQLAEQQVQQAQQQGQQPTALGGSGGGQQQQRGTPVLITRGSADKVISSAAVEQTAAALRRDGLEVALHSVPGKGHAMPQGQAEMRRLMEFWAAHLSRRPTAADLPPGMAAAAAGGPGELLEVGRDVTLERAPPGSA